MKRIIYISTIIVLFTSFIAAQTVYVTKTGKKYHSAGCSYLKSSISIILEDAIDRGYTPCSRCSPPTKVTPTNKQGLNDKQDLEKGTTTTTKKKEKKTSSRCLATTKKGTQCKRNAKPGSNYCWQHQR